MTHLACLPYENRDDLLVAVIKFRGSYFMCEFETEAKKIERETETPRQKEMSAWGFKFEQYVTSGEWFCAEIQSKKKMCPYVKVWKCLSDYW